MTNKDFIKKNWETMTIADMARTLKIGESSVRRAGAKLCLPKKSEMVKEVDISEVIHNDIESKKKKAEETNIKSKYSYLLEKFEEAEKEIEAFKRKSGPDRQR